MNRIPTSTYRLQFRAQMGFRAAQDLIPYLRDLGVDWLYASPLARAKGGSTHGYDVVDPTVLDPALGTEAEFAGLTDALREHELGLLVDIVPNHMTTHGHNPWWRDLLEHGRASSYAEFFDIRWAADPEGRLVLPVLGRHYGEVLEAGELTLDLDDQGFIVRYYDHIFPLDPRSWATIIRRVAEQTDDATVADLLAVCDALPPRVSDPEVRTRRGDATVTARDLLQRIGHDVELEPLVRSTFDSFDWDALHQLLEVQAYRLAYWRSGLGELNYRRFFDIAELIALRAERQEVFDATHALPLAMLERGQIHGVRIDHIDGLADPCSYVKRLRAHKVPYVVVEKILTGSERLRSDWPADGTTGYEFVKAVGPLFVNERGYAHLESDYLDIEMETGFEGNGEPYEDFDQCVRTCKQQALDELFAPSLDRLVQDLRTITVFDLHARDVSFGELERALKALTVELPVYRTYLDEGPVSEEDTELIAGSLDRARQNVRPEDRIALEFIGRVLLRRSPWTGEAIRRALGFIRRWQQLSGPVMAKGLEDTALYRYTPLLALNEVGAHPVMPEDPAAQFHAWAQDRVAHGARSLSTSSTHDTKRGEDTRARLYALSELHDDWVSCRDLCQRELERAMNKRPHPDELQTLLQTVVGAWPLEPRELPEFPRRVHEYLIKAAREAKQRTSWLQPNADAEDEITRQADILLEAIETRTWGRAIAMFRDRVAFLGALNSLSHLALKLASPGVCDVYQGSELWDLTLVDPDNRRPVDFAGRHTALRTLQAEDIALLLPTLRSTWTDARLKLLLTWRGLSARREHPDLFVDGDYVPLTTAGAHHERTLAFARRHENKWLLVIVGRRLDPLTYENTWPIGSVWDEGTFAIPQQAPTQWRDLLTQAPLEINGTIALPELFRELPLRLLLSE